MKTDSCHRVKYRLGQIRDSLPGKLHSNSFLNSFVFKYIKLIPLGMLISCCLSVFFHVRYTNRKIFSVGIRALYHVL